MKVTIHMIDDAAWNYVQGLGELDLLEMARDYLVEYYSIRENWPEAKEFIENHVTSKGLKQ